MTSSASGAMSKPSTAFVAFAMSANLGLAILIVLLNKWVYVHINFPNITMTFTHFVVTFLGLELWRRLKIFEAKPLPIMQMLPLAVTFCGFVVFTNLSLGFNTVGTYQILKTLTMPTIMVIQTYYYSKTFSVNIRLTLIPIMFGVYLNSYYDIRFNLTGTIYAIIGVLITSLYQVWVGEKQKQYAVSSMQLLYYQAPLSAALLLVIIPFVEPLDKLWAHQWTVHDLFMVFCTGLVAFLVNVSIYWIIGNTSAVSYNVLGQLKLILTLVGGFLLFNDPLNGLQMLGIVFTLTGVFLYTYIKLQEQNAASTNSQLTKVTVESSAITPEKSHPNNT